jgi:hypothetical protein
MDEVVIFVHPWMWATSMFKDVRARGLGILSIVTEAEGTRIDPSWLDARSDHLIRCPGRVADVPTVSAYLGERGLRAVAVVNGLDSTIVFADALQKDVLGLDLDLADSAIRLNKFEVNDVLRHAGVPSVPTVRITHAADVEALKAEVAGLGSPFIAKPAGDTAGMAGVEILHSPDDLRHYVERHLGRANGYYPDKPVSEVVVQRYMSPSRYREFTVDFLSVDGVHECIGLSENRKDTKGVFRATVTYDTVANPEFAVVTDYVRRCLDALKVRWGFSHNEVFWDMQHEVFLVETNNRYAGQPVTDLYELSYARSPLDPLLARKSDPGEERVALRLRHGAAVYLYNTAVDHPNEISLGDAAGEGRIMDFRGRGRAAIPEDFADCYDRARHIGAIVIVQGEDAARVEELVDGLVQRDIDGQVFRVVACT